MLLCQLTYQELHNTKIVIKSKYCTTQTPPKVFIKNICKNQESMHLIMVEVPEQSQCVCWGENTCNLNGAKKQKVQKSRKGSQKHWNGYQRNCLEICAFLKTHNSCARQWFGTCEHEYLRITCTTRFMIIARPCTFT